MELIYHLGLFSSDEVPLQSSIVRVKGAMILAVLLYSLVVYHIISALCHFIAFGFPEAANNVKRETAALFWDLSIFFLNRNNVSFNITGDEIDTESAIIVSNHQSLTDHIAMAYLARYANSHCSSANQVGENRLTLPRINFFTWFLIWRVPTLRILLNFAKCDENWELEEGLVGTVFQKVLRSKFPEWVILFPEVNIWTPEDASLQNKQSEKYYLPVLRNLLYPRFSGFANTMCAMKSAGNFKFTKIYDITLLYQKHIPSGSAADDTMYTPTLLESFTSKSPITITINVQTKSLSRIPVKRTKLERYLEHTWRDKDKLLIQLRTKAPHIENSASASLPNSLLQPEKPSSSIEGLISNDPSI